MPYLSVLDGSGHELGMPRVDLCDTIFKISPPRRDGDAYCWVNTSQIIFRGCANGGMAVGLGISQDVDDLPFATVAMDAPRQLAPWDALGIRPGMLIVDMWDIRQGSRNPNPLPNAGEVLTKIWDICHRPSKDHPKGGNAYSHFMADFDAIRKLCKPFVDAQRKLREPLS